MRLILTTLAFLVLITSAWATPIRTPYATVDLVAAYSSLTPGAQVQIALRQDLKDGWHTYWRNPGDSGEATSLQWTLPQGYTVSDIQWPAPMRIATGPLMNFGYEGTVLLPMVLTVPEDAPLGSTVTLTADVSWLVCKDICIPENGRVSLNLPVTPTLDMPAAQHKAIAAALARVPVTDPAIEARWTRVGEHVHLSVHIPNLGTPKQAVFFPYDGALITHAATQTMTYGPQGLSLDLTPGYTLKKPSFKAPITGVLQLGTRVVEVSARKGAALPETDGQTLTAPAPPSHTNLILVLGLAALGGLILNLMPCVFPVLSLKASSLMYHAHDRKALRTQALVYTSGVVLSFVALGAAVAGVRAAGADIGWGFQLQSPWAVTALMLVMLSVGLHLSGVFSLGASVQNMGAGLTSARGHLGTFFTGVLAVVVAAPCTAPFMAAALGYALTQPVMITLLVFAALGFGMAAPMLILSFVPNVARLLPRPGAWMEQFKHLLAWPMYGAAAWLLWVVMQQTGAAMAAAALTAALTLAFALWAYGLSQRNTPWRWRIVSLLALAICVITATTTLRRPDGGMPVTEEPFSTQRLADLRAQGRPVFVYFTAAWCVTCLVNERTALSTPEVAAALRDGGFTVLKGDWTNRDPVISRTLQSYGRAGVPLYLVFGTRSADSPTILPQILTPGMVRNTLARLAP
jgi:thiol:disulfide interchange protein DsbD